MQKEIQYVLIFMILTFLGVSAYFDLRWKRIPWWVLGMGAIFVCVTMITNRGFSIENFLSFLPGVILLGLSFITKESIGYGDGVSVMILGGMIGIRNCMWVLCVSLVMMSVVGIILMTIKRATRKTRIPYIPFMLAAESFLLIGANL